MSTYLHSFQDANARASDAIASVLDFSKKKKPGTTDEGESSSKREIK